MFEAMDHAVSGSVFMPHGYCFLWTPSLVTSHVLSDFITAVSYFSIPFALWHFVQKRTDLPFRWVFVLFGIFVMACGGTHLFSIWNIWFADYWLEAGVKGVTAATSLATAVLMWPLIPRALAVPSQQQLAQANRDLQREIERRTRVEEELRRINRELENRTDQLDLAARDLARSNGELEQFAYVASHDLQEPLRMVTGYVQLLEKRLVDKLDRDTREFMDFAVDGAQRMQSLIHDILAYSRVGTRGRPLEPVDSADAFNDALKPLTGHLAETGAEVEAQKLPRVTADRTQLVQLFQNLIGNAIKFCKDGTPRVQVRAERQAEGWRFSVTDNGIGIAAEYREQIFEIFKRLHSRREYPGTGIGLAICKRIVERHGGEIGIDPAPGGGSVFWFTLPEERGS